MLGGSSDCRRMEWRIDTEHSNGMEGGESVERAHPLRWLGNGEYEDHCSQQGYNDINGD